MCVGGVQVIAERPDEYRAGDHTYWKDGLRVPGFSEIAAAMGMVSFDRIPREVLMRARDVGQAVHMATQFHDEGRLDRSTVSPEIDAYLNAYLDFLESTGFQPVEIETPVMNVEYGYACTPDRVGTFRGHRSTLAVVEIKKAMIADVHHCQVEAQAICFKGSPSRNIIHLRPDGRWRPVPHDADVARYHRGIWLSAASVYHFNMKTKEDLWRRKAA